MIHDCPLCGDDWDCNGFELAGDDECLMCSECANRDPYEFSDDGDYDYPGDADDDDVDWEDE